MIEPVDLHLVSWNRPKMTELVIRTIHRNTPRELFRLHVLDNGSEPKTKEMLARMHLNGEIDSLDSQSENRGLEWARQQLFFTQTAGKYFVDIDNDCLPPKGWLYQQLLLIQDFPAYAAISQRTQVMIGTGNIFEEADQTSAPLVDFPHPGGSFRLMNSFAVKEVGGWDRGAPGRGSEERYICGKLRDFGYKTAFATQIQCLHLFGVRSQTPERWGYSSDMQPEDSGHSDIWHPALANGDEYDEVVKYAGAENADRYHQAD